MVSCGSHVECFCFFVLFLLASMAWPTLNTPTYESLIATDLGCNHGHRFTLDRDKALLESLARENEDCRVIDGMGDPMSAQPPIATQPSLTKLSPQDVGATLPPSKRSLEEKKHMPILELEMLAHSYFVQFTEYSRTRKNVTQLVPSIVWWKVYEGFHEEFYNITY